LENRFKDVSPLGSANGAEVRAEIDASAFIPMTAKTASELGMKKDSASGRDVGWAFQAVLPSLIITGRRTPGREWLA
jgi:hypothetical protein